MGIRDLIDISPPPRLNWMGFLGGRWSVNISTVLAVTELYQVGEGSAFLTSYFEGGNQITSGAHDDRSRAEATHAFIMDKWLHADELHAEADRLASESYVEARERRLDNLSGQELVDLVDNNTLLLAKVFETHYYVSVGGGEFSSQLEGLITNHIPDHPPEWSTTLTSALLDVESARPGKEIWDMSRLVLARKTLASEVAASSPEHILIRLAAPPNSEWREFSEAYRGFMREFGWRGQRESDPATATWEEVPGFVISAIKADLAAPEDHNPHKRELRAAAAREELERSILSQIPEGARATFAEHLAITQTLSRRREGVKTTWTRISRNYRWPLMELGRRLAKASILAEPDDVWYLRLDEVRKAGEGTLEAATTLRAVEERKAEFAKLETFTLPEDVFNWPCALVPIRTDFEEGNREFSALGVSPGVATGRARVILNANGLDDSHIEPGEILIAPITDAPWTPLFIPAGAVVVEVGGMLSHAATVAREFGIPGVSGVRDATRIIKTGQLVTVDGNAGTVTVHPE